jgi:hypothetical protein
MPIFVKAENCRGAPDTRRIRKKPPTGKIVILKKGEGMDRTLCFRCMRSLDQEDEFHFLMRTCEKCFATVVESHDKNLSAYLESLDMPAALLNRDQIVLVSNGSFRRMAIKDNIVGLRLGEIMECMYAPLLGCCGDTVPCLLCRLRISVERTWETGEGLRGVSVSFPHKAEGRKTFTIATEVVGAGVLLVMGTTPRQAPR